MGIYKSHSSLVFAFLEMDLFFLISNYLLRIHKIAEKCHLLNYFCLKRA